MISGVTLLKKEDSYKKNYIRFLKILISLVIFSFIYYIKDCIATNSSISMINFFKLIYQKNITNAFWYMYLYLGIILMIPIIQRMVSNFKKLDLKYFIFFSLVVCGSMPILNYYFPNTIYSSNFDLFLFNVYLGLIFTGYYIENYMKITKSKMIICVFIFVIFIVLNVFFTYMEYLKNPDSYLFFDNRCFITITIPSICIFIIVKYLFNNKRKIINFISLGIKEIGACTFTTYLLSDLLIELLAKEEIFLNGYLNPLISVIIYQITIFIVGIIISFILRRIPLIKKIL